MTRTSDRTRRFRLTLAGLVAAAVVTAGCTLPAFAPRADVEGEAAPRGRRRPGSPAPRCPRSWSGAARPGCATSAPASRSPATGPAAAAPRPVPGAGETFEIALIRIRSDKQRDRIGSLLVNPGGPGGSGVDTAVYLTFGEQFGGLPDTVLQRFDIVGFDPRGVARSSPVECIPDADLDAAFGFDPDPAEPGVVRRFRRAQQADRPGLRRQVRRPAAAVRHRAGRPGHGRHPRGGRRREDDATSATPTAPCSAPRTPNSSRSGCGRWCSTARSTPGRA